MYRRVIADDEDLILQGLRNVVDWTSVGFEVVGCHENGEQVLSHLAEDRPDAILADIKMPIMDGLVLLQQIRTMGYRDMEFVFLTGYDDFELIQSAIRLGAQDYILKPSSPDEILQTFSKVRVRLDEKAANQQQEISKRFSESRLNYIKSTMNMVFSGNQRMFARYQMDYVPLAGALESVDKWSMALLTTENAVLSGTPTMQNAAALKELKRRALEAEKKDGSKMISCFNRYYAALLFMDVSSVEIIRQIDAIKHDCACAAPIVSVWSDVSDSFWETHRALYGRLFLPNIPHKYIQLYYFAENDMALHAAVEDYNGSMIRSCLQAGFARIQDIEDPCREQILMRTFYVLGSSILEQGECTEEELNDLREQIAKASFDTAKMILLSYVQAKYDTAEWKDGTTRNYHLCMEVARYIQENYAEEITLNDLAERFYISPNYLGTQFRRNLGIGIRQFQTEFRLDKADELIAEHRFRLYEIAEMVGYKNYEHFRKTYAKLRGHNPSEE